MRENRGGVGGRGAYKTGEFIIGVFILFALGLSTLHESTVSYISNYFNLKATFESLICTGLSNIPPFF